MFMLLLGIFVVAVISPSLLMGYALLPEYPAAVKKPSQGEKTTKTTPADNTLQRMVDREAKRAEGKGVGYDRWAAKYNLKQMAATVTAYQQYGFSSHEELDEACSAAYTGT